MNNLLELNLPAKPKYADHLQEALELKKMNTQAQIEAYKAYAYTYTWTSPNSTTFYVKSND